jgi:ribonucleoside-diphosphate reductase alpha chain
MDITIKKRNGQIEKFDAEKVNKVVEWATKNVSGISANDILMNANINFYDGISSKEIHDSLIKSAEDLISIDHPNYTTVTARLLTYGLRKEVWGGNRPPRLIDHIKNCVSIGVYTDELLTKYTEDEINKIDKWIDHSLDETMFDFAGMNHMLKTALVQDRVNKKVYETPQFAFMCIGMVHFADYESARKLQFVKEFYEAVSHRKLNIPTPMLTRWRTNAKSGASCCLIQVDDTSDSIFSSAHLMANATSYGYGIGLDFSRIRGMGSPVKNGETVHSGVIPYLKVFQDSIKSQQQGGARRGAGTATAPIFHWEIESILQLKNVGGTEYNRVRHLDYCIAISKLFYERWTNDENITLFSYHEVPEVFDSFGMPEFDDLYIKAENNPNLKFKKSVPANELFDSLIKERIETNRIYILNIDLANEFSPWMDRVSMTNLCVEVLHPTIPCQYLNDPNGEIGTCLLAATNMVNIKSDEDHRKVCHLAVRMLDDMIERQIYFAPAAERFTKNKRSLGIGITNLAGWLATKGLNHDSPESPNVIDEFMEKQQYYLMEASWMLAKEKGKAPDWNRSKYAHGYSKLDLYKKDIDEVVTRKPTLDWKTLMENIWKDGMRNMTLSCAMPCEKSSLMQNSTNGMEPIIQLFQFKDDRQGSAAWIAPGAKKYGKYYKSAYDCSNENIIKCVAAVMKWLCMSASGNHYYNYGNYEDNKLESTDVAYDILLSYKYGWKTLYYAKNKQVVNKDTTLDENPKFNVTKYDPNTKDVREEAPNWDLGCAGGACSL